MPPPPTPNPQHSPNAQTFFSTVLNPAATTPAAAQTTTPPRPTSRTAPTAPSTTTSSTTTPAAPPSFTPTQRSLQARGKSYTTPTAGEAYETRQLREQAANILGSTELLLWYCAARNETLPQTRHHFQNVMLGLPPPEPQWIEEYEVPVEQRVRHGGADVVMGGSGGSPARGKGKGREKERERERGKRKS